MPTQWALVAVAAFLATLPLEAQTVEILVREDSSRSPIAGAIVRLIGDRGPVAQALTSERGRVVLRAPGPGRYRIRVDRIGYEGTLGEPLPLGAGAIVRTEVAMPSTRLLLPTLVVEGKTRCTAAGGEGFATVLWDEIRKALTANVITSRGLATPLHVREFQRELDRRGTPIREWVFSSAVVEGQPFATLPPEQLAQSGFVVDMGDSTEFAGPDAALLLSDGFVGTHCFRAVPGPAPLVGLRFEPTPGREVPDVVGTLWVDRATNELRHLDYRYTGLGRRLADADLGGRVEFQRLPDGAWVVSYWHVRMPRMEQVVSAGRSERNARLVGYLDRGGRADPATDETGFALLAVVAGTVHDSTTGSGLSGAIIRIAGRRDSVFTGPDGGYRLAVSAAGDQVVTVEHPKLALVRTSPSRPVLLSLGDTARVDFATPSIPTLARLACGAPRGRSGVVGIARTSDGVAPVGLTVWASWPVPAAADRGAEAMTGSRGIFALCDLPSGPEIAVRLTRDNLVLAERRVGLGRGEFRWVDLDPSVPLR